MTQLKFLPLILLLLILEVDATQVHHLSLEEVLGKDVSVIVATVVSSEVEIQPNSLLVSVEFENPKLLKGYPATSPMIYSFSTLLVRQYPDGSKLRASPIREGSGMEQNLEVGKRYIFLKGEKNTLLRVEPMESLERVQLRIQSLESEG